MLGDYQNPKDIPKNFSKDTSALSSSLVASMGTNSLSYTKTSKLITALYMVTDNMEKDEPMRLKLRTLGVEILSDAISADKTTIGHLVGRSIEVLSFLSIAFDMDMISEMNFSILKKEFLELRDSSNEFSKKSDSVWLRDFMQSGNKEDFSIGHEDKRANRIIDDVLYRNTEKRQYLSVIKGQDMPIKQGIRIGVQKGDTLLNALNRVESVKDTNVINRTSNFQELKNKRREAILKFIKDRKQITGMDGATITDIKNGAGNSISSCGEKTLQRELVSMVKENILTKRGDKRWSQYFLAF